MCNTRVGPGTYRLRQTTMTSMLVVIDILFFAFIVE